MAKRVMTQAAQAVLDQALRLPPDERAKVFDILYDSLDPRLSTRIEPCPRSARVSPGKTLKAGCLPGFQTSPDFDEPLDFTGRPS